VSQSLAAIALRDRGVDTYAAVRPSVGPMRWVRGAVVGSVASTLAWLGHSLASGMSPEPSAAVWTTACAALVAVALSGRRWRLPSLLAVLLGAQVAFHVVFADVGHTVHPGHGTMSASMTHDGTVGHGWLGAFVLGHTGTLMALAHVCAALVTALLLRRGEDWCWALVRLLTMPLAMVRAVGGRLTQRRHLAAPRLSYARELLLLADCQSRRGPPLTVA
jgi:hypothetical protein